MPILGLIAMQPLGLVQRAMEQSLHLRQQTQQQQLIVPP